MTGEKVVTWQQRLCPEATHAVLTAGEQNVAHCAPAQRRRGKKRGHGNGLRVKITLPLYFKHWWSLYLDSTDSMMESFHRSGVNLSVEQRA